MPSDQDLSETLGWLAQEKGYWRECPTGSPAPEHRQSALELLSLEERNPAAGVARRTMLFIDVVNTYI
jgi:hypothetical protein